jgi:aspartate/methionine/tyrosine aminotransferase
MPPREIEHLYHRCRAYGALYCSDECYIDLYDGTPPVSLLQVAESDLRGALVFLSLSKRSGMTGYRSGAVVGDAAAIAALRRLRTSTGTASPEFTQAAAAAAWSDDDHVARRREVFAAKRAILRVTFEKLGYGVVASRAGIYLWVFVRDDLKVSERLLDRGVLVSPGRIFGEGGEGYIRLALVPTLDECEEAAKAIYRCLTGN